MPPPPGEPPPLDDPARFEIIIKHGHQDLVQAVAFNAYGDRCATGSVDGKIRVFNRHRDGVWRLCDSWGAHGGEILELQWLPPTIYPNLLASLGIEGRFKLWTEDPGAAPGRRFSQRGKGAARAAFETRSPRSAYRSFSMKHDDETRHTYLALLATDGTLTVLENEVPENLGDYVRVDELRVCPRPARGEEASFRVRFDPNPEPCFAALRAGVRPDALGLAVAAMDAVRIYRTRPVTTTSYGLQGTGRAFYLAAEIRGHRGLVRDLAWAPANFRGYDILATACQDGYVRVVRLDTPLPDADADADRPKTWAARDVLGTDRRTKQPDAKPKTPAGGLITAAAAAAAAAAEAKAKAKATGGGGGGTASPADGPTASAAATPVAVPASAAHSSHASVASSLSSTAAAAGGHVHTDAASAAAAAADGTLADGAGDEGGGGAAAADTSGTAGGDTAPLADSSATSSAAPSFSGPPEADASTGNASTGVSGITSGLSGLGGLGGFGGLGSLGGHGGGSGADRGWTGEAGQVRHVVREMARLENHRTPVWRVAFDDDGQILGSVGDDGKLLCYRQTPDGGWARSAELTVLKMRMMVP